MTNLTRLRLILVDLSGLMQKRTHLKQNVLFFKEIYHIHLLYSKKMTPVGWKHKRYRVYIYNVFILRTTEFLETGVYNLHIYI